MGSAAYQDSSATQNNLQASYRSLYPSSFQEGSLRPTPVQASQTNELGFGFLLRRQIAHGVPSSDIAPQALNLGMHSRSTKD